MPRTTFTALLSGCSAMAIVAAPVAPGSDGLLLGSAAAWARDKGGGDRGGHDRGSGRDHDHASRDPGTGDSSHSQGGPRSTVARERERPLAAQGVASGARRDGTFRNHGERVHTMVELAKALGYPASVGALQGNFGTPFENGLAPMTRQLADARLAAAVEPDNPWLQAEVARLKQALATAVDALPATGDQTWATIDLDVTGDGVVDAADLTAIVGSP
jgi:hypothetical protein